MAASPCNHDSSSSQEDTTHIRRGKNRDAARRSRARRAETIIGLQSQVAALLADNRDLLSTIQTTGQELDNMRALVDRLQGMKEVVEFDQQQQALLKRRWSLSSSQDSGEHVTAPHKAACVVTTGQQRVADDPALALLLPKRATAGDPPAPVGSPGVFAALSSLTASPRVNALSSLSLHSSPLSPISSPEPCRAQQQQPPRRSLPPSSHHHQLGVLGGVPPAPPLPPLLQPCHVLVPPDVSPCVPPLVPLAPPPCDVLPPAPTTSSWLPLAMGSAPCAPPASWPTPKGALFALQQGSLTVDIPSQAAAPAASHPFSAPGAFAGGSAPTCYSPAVPSHGTASARGSTSLASCPVAAGFRRPHSLVGGAAATLSPSGSLLQQLQQNMLRQQQQLLQLQEQQQQQQPQAASLLQPTSFTQHVLLPSEQQQQQQQGGYQAFASMPVPPSFSFTSSDQAQANGSGSQSAHIFVASAGCPPSACPAYTSGLLSATASANQGVHSSPYVGSMAGSSRAASSVSAIPATTWPATAVMSPASILAAACSLGQAVSHPMGNSGGGVASSRSAPCASCDLPSLSAVGGSSSAVQEASTATWGSMTQVVSGGTTDGAMWPGASAAAANGMSTAATASHVTANASCLESGKVMAGRAGQESMDFEAMVAMAAMIDETDLIPLDLM